MVLNLLSFFVGFLLLIMISIILISRKEDKQLNIFFLLLLAFSGIQRFVFGLGAFDVISTASNPFQKNQLFAYVFPPIYYLFFETLLNKKVALKKVILHFSAPLLIISLIKLIAIGNTYSQLLFFTFTTVYVFFLIDLLWKLLVNRKTSKELVHFKTVKTWSVIMFTFFIVLYFFSNYIYFLQGIKVEFNMLEEFYTLTSIFWLIIIGYVFKNPIILYGEQLLTKQINQVTGEELEVWRNNIKSPIDEGDIRLEEKVKNKVYKIIFSLKKIESESMQELVELSDIKALAFKLDYPQSYIKFVFKYYANYTFGEYQNIIKIKMAIKLIKSGFLDTHTIDKLSTTCLYSNRFTFFKNFKKFTGYSPTAYAVNFAKKP